MKSHRRRFLFVLLILSLLILPVCAVQSSEEAAVYEARLEVIRQTYEYQLKEATSLQTILGQYWWVLVAAALLGCLVTARVFLRINAVKVGKVRLEALQENTRIKQQYSQELSRLRQQTAQNQIRTL